MIAAPTDDYRLSRDVVPSAYRVRLSLDPAARSFDGTVEIDVDVAVASREVVLNAVGLTGTEATVTTSDGTVVEATSAADDARERVTLGLACAVEGSATVRMSFSGTIGDGLVGIYASSYADASGASHTVVATQFCLTEARRAFPCFDEPSMKATYALTLEVPDGMLAYSNTPVAAERPVGDARREVCFVPTIRMSSYLVAFVVGEFDRSEVVDVDGVSLSVVCTPSKAHLTTFALEVGAFALRFFSDYFGVAYPADKLDLVGIPDFAYGGMENFGCILFREMLLLVDPQAVSLRERTRVAMVVAHEVAHMWFGDLVTMAWWEGIWLNEAFATFLMYLCCDAMHPEWQMWIEFSEQREIGLSIDALHTTRAIEFPVRSPADAAAMIDPITYQKGGTVLRMLEQYLGAMTFRDGIREYLSRHAYANTETKDLWSALEAASGQPVAEIMNTWILQGGHPVVTSSSGMLSQRPFMLTPATDDSNIGSDWLVPIVSRPLHGGEASSQLLGDLPSPVASHQPAIVNAGGSGAYRTSYDTVELEAIAADLGLLTEIERAVHIGDTWALAMAGDRTVADVLTLARGLGTLAEPSSWTVVAQVLMTLDRIVDEATRPALERATRAIMRPALDALGFERRPRDDERAGRVRNVLMWTLGQVGADADVRTRAAEAFAAGDVEGDLADAIIATVAARGRSSDRDEMLARLAAAKDPQTEQRYRTGIAAIADAELCVATFDECFERFRVQDVPYVILGLVSNRVGGPAVWERLAVTWDETVAKIPALMQSLLTEGTATFVGDRAFAERVAVFHRAHQIETGQQHVEQALEQMLVGVRLAERTRPTIAAVLAAVSGSTDQG